MKFTFLLRHYSKNIWGNLFVSVLSSFGALWLFVEISYFFLSDESLFIIKVKDCWYIFVLLGLLVAIIIARPKFTFGYKLSNRDIIIEIAIGNLLKRDCSLIIGTNTTFDTHISNDLISDGSIQGQFTKLIYNGDESQLDKDISFELKDIQSEILNEKRTGKNRKYPIGTTVKLNRQKRNFYLLALANINEHGVASSTYDDFKHALACLWLFIGKKGLKENIAIPVIGSGFSRLIQKREIIIREIIRSFVAACSESTFCDKLTIVLNPSDIKKYNIDIGELENFIRYICEYTEFSNNSDKIGHQI
jgi:hypothetical protein